MKTKKFLCTALLFVFLFCLFGCEQNKYEIGDVIRTPGFGLSNVSQEEYDESGLDYPTIKEVNDESLKEKTITIKIGKQEYTASYDKSKRYPEGSSEFLKKNEYDCYTIKGPDYPYGSVVSIEVFHQTNEVKSLSLFTELADGEIFVSDFSENGLRTAAEDVLHSVYGSEIAEHLENYYRFDSAKQNPNLGDIYKVVYTAYLNGVPTRDFLFVYFYSDGRLHSVSANKYLQFKDYPTENLIPVKLLHKKMENYMGELGYISYELGDWESACYILSSEGILYYITDWECTTESVGTVLEELALKAE